MDLEQVVKDTWARLGELGFEKIMDGHDEGRSVDGYSRLRVLVGCGCGSVRVRLQRPSNVVSGRWIQLHAVDISSEAQRMPRLHEIAVRVHEYNKNTDKES